MDSRITAELLLETMAEGVLLLDSGGRIVVWNQAMSEMTGYSREEALGKEVSWLKSPRCEGDVLHKLGQEAPSCVTGCECKILDRAGKDIPVLVNARVLTADDGASLGILQTISDIRAVDSLRRELRALESKLVPEDELQGLIGHSAAMRRVKRLIGLASESEVTTLLLGASGTGKELAAAAIHALGGRRDKPFVKVNCGALSESLLESELFGHVKGAFTGAFRDRTGRFEAADGGTIFLDEIGDISPLMQVKLLRVLQEGELERVGGEKTLRVDVRVIAATNRDLSREMKEGRFREDLYYRLKVFPIVLPSLAERREDLPQLAQHFINCFAAQTGKLVRGIRAEALRILMLYDWPGNVRELENAIEYAFVVCRQDVIGPEDLPDEVRSPGNRGGLTVQTGVKQGYRGLMPDRETLLHTLSESGWNKAEAGRRLGVSRTAVWKWMLKYELSGPG